MAIPARLGTYYIKLENVNIKISLETRNNIRLRTSGAAVFEQSGSKC